MTCRNQQPASFIERGAGPTTRKASTVVVNRVDVIGLRLSIRLLDAGYRVLGLQVSDRWRQQFEASGGRVPDRKQEHQATWLVTLPATADPRPDQLAGLLSVAPTRSRPRVALLGGAAALDDLQRRTVSTIQIRAGSQSSGVLTVLLAVGRHGTELGVLGDQELFEQALPLLTALSDRVLFAPDGMHSKN